MIARLFHAALLLLLASCAKARDDAEAPAPRETVTWEGLRDADLWVRSDGAAESVTVGWVPVWEAEGFAERLYWYGPRGELLARVEIDGDALSGRRRLALDAGAGDYRLVVPGPSRRRFAVDVPGTARSVLAPTKLHRALDRPGAEPLYWRAQGEPATLLLRSRRGQTRLETAVCGEDGADCRPGESLISLDGGVYRNRESAPLPRSGVVRILLPARAKGSVWIDGGANLFAKRPADWFVPERPDGHATIRIGGSAGTMPLIGTYLEFYIPNAARSALIRRLGASAAQTYVPEDTLTRRPEHDVPILKAYAAAGIERVHAILNDTRRDSLTDDEAASVAFLASYLDARSEQGIGPASIAFVDEPNLRYRDYDDFAAYFAEQAAMIRTHSDPAVRSMTIAAPEASLFTNPPTRASADRYLGQAWAERLLTDQWDSVDVVSWHEWNVRNLAATDRFAETIASAQAMNARLAKRFDAAPKALAITQTNLNSGPETSDYEADGFYAGLWWASVVAESANAGSLDALYWFKSVDEGRYPKGLMRCHEGGECAMKPVGEVFAALQSFLLPDRLETESDAHAVRALATTDASGRVAIMLVNQDARVFQTTLSTPAGLCPDTVRTLRDVDGAVDVDEGRPGGGRLSLAPSSITLLSGAMGGC